MIDRIFVGLRLGLTLIALVLAFHPITAQARCRLTGPRPSLEELGYFAVNPGGALVRAQRDPSKLITIVARYVEADLGLLPKVKTLAELAPSRYKMAIGAGLGIAQQTCSGSDPQTIKAIQTFVAGIQDESLLSGYKSVSDNGNDLRSVTAPVLAPKPSLDDQLRLADPFRPLPIPQP